MNYCYSTSGRLRSAPSFPQSVPHQQVRKYLRNSGLRVGYRQSASAVKSTVLRLGCEGHRHGVVGTVMSSHMFCTRSHLFSHFSAFGLNLSHVTTTNTASLVMCGPVYSHYTHQQSRGCHASHARSHPATYIIIHSLSSTTLLFTII